MKLTEFRVRPYRNVGDSGWVKVQRVTALVGRNEGGESNLREGLM
jgi:AAA15 family ATPase/GTPase